MNFLSSKKLKLISSLFDKMVDTKWHKKPYLQLLFLFNFDIFNIQQNFIAKSIVLRLDTLIMSLFLKFFGHGRGFHNKQLSIFSSLLIIYLLT